MEEQYAIVSKKVALVCGLVCFLVFMAMIYPVFNIPKEPERAFFCGVTSHSENKKFMDGKMLFINNCAQCHNKNMKDKLTGPALQNRRAYWVDENELFLFLTQKKTSKNRKYTTAYKLLKKEYSPATCILFPAFTKEEVSQIAIYLERR